MFYVVTPRLFLLSVILFVFLIFLFIATMSLLATFLSVVFYIFYFIFPAYLGRYYRFFYLVWFRLSCDHGWIRSGSVNVR